MVRTRSVSAATLRKSLFELPQEAGHVGAHPVGEFLLAQLVPEMFLGINLGRIGRQAVAADGFRDQQGLGQAGTGYVNNHDDEFVGVSGAHLTQKMAHHSERLSSPTRLSTVRVEASFRAPLNGGSHRLRRQ